MKPNLSWLSNPFKSKTTDPYRPCQHPIVEYSPHTQPSLQYAYPTQPYPQPQVYTQHQTMQVPMSPFIYQYQAQHIIQPAQLPVVCGRIPQNHFRNDVTESASLQHPPIQNASHHLYQNGNLAHQFQQQNLPSHNQPQHHHQQSNQQPQQLPQPHQQIAHQQPQVQYQQQQQEQQQQYQNHQMLTSALELPLEAQCLMYESSSKELRTLSGIIRRDIDKLKRELEAIGVDLPDYDVVEAKI